MNSKWQYHKELIYHLKMQHALPEDILIWINIVSESVEIGIHKLRTPKEQATIIKKVIEDRETT